MAIVSPQPAGSPVALRGELGLSQAQAGRLAGVGERHVRRLEAEPRLTPAAVKLASAYVAVGALVNGREAS
jgi:hypothetical protein